MSDDVQQPAPDEAKNTHGVAPEDDTEAHRLRGGSPAAPEAPGAEDFRLRPSIADDTDDVEGHIKRH